MGKHISMRKGWNSNERLPVKKRDKTVVTRLTAVLKCEDDEFTVDALLQGRFETLTDAAAYMNELTGKEN